MSLLITTGATETFKDLISFSVSEKFLNFVTSQTKLTKIIIQFGNNIAFFNKCVSNVTKLKQVENCNDANQSICYEYEGKLQIQAYQFNLNILRDVEDSDYVISHAGTGSILDSLRLKKPLLVIINDKLMDNHQLDIAKEFESGNYLKYYRFSKDDDSKLFILLDSFLNGKIHFNILPTANRKLLNELIAEPND